MNLIETFSEFKELKNIDRATMMSVLEDVFRNLLLKNYGTDENFDIIINPDKGDLEIWRNRVVVKDGEVEDSNLQIPLLEAKKIDTDYELGEEVTDEVTESAVTEAEGLNLDIVTEKALQEEETDVLEDLSKAEISSNNLEEPLEVADMVDMEGVQDLESVDLISKSGEGELKTEVEEPNSDLDELGEEFEGEKLDLEDMSRQNLTPVFNKEELENPDKKPDKSIFELNVLSHPKYKTFPKPRKNSTMYVNYLIYVQLNNMMIDFYNKNGVEVKKICLNNKHSYLAQIKQYLDKVGKSLKVEEVEGLSYVI